MSGEAQKPARYIDPSDDLKRKVGGTRIDPRTVERAQKEIEDTRVDIKPVLKDLLEHYQDSLSVEDGKNKAELAKTAMQIKASAGMFGYGLLSRVAANFLAILEESSSMNKDMLRLVEAHYDAVSLIIHRDMKGEGDASGKLLFQELKDACGRYRNKYIEASGTQ